MTNAEQQSINRLYELLSGIKNENAIFKAEIQQAVQSTTGKVDKKIVPVQLEQDILKASQIAISDSIKAALGAYNSPMQKLVLEVVTEHQSEVKSLIKDAFTSVIRTDEFKQSIVNAFSHKVARTIISNNDGLFDKVANDLKQDAIFKSKMAIAVSNVVEECLNERKP